MLEAFPPGGRDRRLVSAILVLAAIGLPYLAVRLTADGVFYFGDTLLTFFLAWLLAFIISPIVTRIVAAIPRLPRAAAAGLGSTALVAGRRRARSVSSSRRSRTSARTWARSSRRCRPGSTRSGSRRSTSPPRPWRS